MRQLIVVFICIVLTGCATNPIPKNYSGPLACVSDSIRHYSERKTDFFNLSAINGKKILDSSMKTKKANYGRGFKMSPEVLERNIPAGQSLTVTIEGHTQYAAPILAVFGETFSISGDVEFTPEPNKVYIVRGVLGEKYSAIWIQNLRTEEIVTSKIEIRK